MSTHVRIWVRSQPRSKERGHSIVCERSEAARMIGAGLVVSVQAIGDKQPVNYVPQEPKPQNERWRLLVERAKEESAEKTRRNGFHKGRRYGD